MKGRINNAVVIISIAGFSLIGFLFPQECHAQIMMRTYVELTSTGLKPAAGDVNFTAYFKADGDNVIETEDTFNNTENTGYYYALGYCRAYSIVVRHRNHLAVMSATAHPLSSSSSTQYDFTLSQDRAYGSDPMKELTAGLYGMVSGDVLSLGVVNAACRSEVWNNRGQSGYRVDDCTMSGVTEAGDRSLTWGNRGRETGVPGFDYQLR